MGTGKQFEMSGGHPECLFGYLLDNLEMSALLSFFLAMPIDVCTNTSISMGMPMGSFPETVIWNSNFVLTSIFPEWRTLSFFAGNQKLPDLAAAYDKNKTYTYTYVYVYFVLIFWDKTTTKIEKYN